MTVLAVAHSVTLLVPLVVLCSAAGFLAWERDTPDDDRGCRRFRESRRAARRVQHTVSQRAQTDGSVRDRSGEVG